ncbi:MAG: hypothetical protein GQ474_07985 [Sulfurimonas sp.]|nr:hypothetical protein [Sulfurimonas sp.]
MNDKIKEAEPVAYIDQLGCLTYEKEHPVSIPPCYTPLYTHPSNDESKQIARDNEVIEKCAEACGTFSNDGVEQSGDWINGYCSGRYEAEAEIRNLKQEDSRDE